MVNSSVFVVVNWLLALWINSWEAHVFDCKLIFPYYITVIMQWLRYILTVLLLWIV